MDVAKIGIGGAVRRASLEMAATESNSTTPSRAPSRAPTPLFDGNTTSSKILGEGGKRRRPGSDLSMPASPPNCITSSQGGREREASYLRASFFADVLDPTYVDDAGEERYNELPEHVYPELKSSPGILVVDPVVNPPASLRHLNGDEPFSGTDEDPFHSSVLAGLAYRRSSATSGSRDGGDGGSGNDVSIRRSSSIPYHYGFRSSSTAGLVDVPLSSSVQHHGGLGRRSDRGPALESSNQFHYGFGEEDSVDTTSLLAESYLPTFVATTVAESEADGGVSSSDDETARSTTATGASTCEPGRAISSSASKSRMSKATGTSSISTGDMYYRATAETVTAWGDKQDDVHRSDGEEQRRNERATGNDGLKVSVENERVQVETSDPVSGNDASPNVSILQRRGSLTRSISVTMGRRRSAGRRSSDTSIGSYDFEYVWEETQRRQRRRAVMAVVALIIGLAIIVATVSTRLIGRDSNDALGINTDQHSPDSSEGSIDVAVNETADAVGAEETEIYELFEADFFGICSDGPGGKLSPSSKARVEEALLQYFNDLAECHSEGYHVRQDELTNSIALIEWKDAPSCASIGTTGSSSESGGRLLQRRLKSKGRFQRRAICRFCDRLITSTKAASSPAPRIPQGRRHLQDKSAMDPEDCSGTVDLVSILRDQGFFALEDAYVGKSDRLSCDDSSSSCTGADGFYGCCGAEKCRCRHSSASESLCLSERCNISQGICCQTFNNGDDNFLYPPCKDTPTCKSMETKEIYEIVEAEFLGICSDGPRGTLSDLSKAKIEGALLRYLNDLADCESDGHHINQDEITKSLALIDWQDAKACDEQSDDDDSRQDRRHLQRRLKSKGRFQRRATCRFCDKLVRTSVSSTSQAPPFVRHLSDDCYGEVDLVSILLDEGFSTVQEAYIGKADNVDCAPSSDACIGAVGGNDFPCCGADGCKCRHSSSSLCTSISEPCSLPGNWCCGFDLRGDYRYPECENSSFCQALPVPSEVYETFEADFDGICSDDDSKTNQLTDQSKADLERAILAFLNSENECSTGAEIPDEVVSSITLVSWTDGSTCAEGGAGVVHDGRLLQRRVKSKGRFNKKARCRLCDRHAESDIKDRSGTANILEARGGSLNVFQHQKSRENIFARNERSDQRMLQEGSSLCQNDTLVDFILEESEENEATAFANISEAAIVTEEEVDCSPFSSACSGADGRDDFPCCGAEGCKCRFHSESLCLDEQCGLPGGLCCSLEEGGGGFTYNVCTRDCLGLEGQCKDQAFATSDDVNDGEFYLSNVLEIEQICGEEINGDLSGSQRSQLEFLLLSYANNILDVAGCGDSSFTSVTVTQFEQGSSCGGGFGGREGSALIRFNAAGICSKDGTCPDRYPLDTSPTLQRLLTENAPSILDRYDRRRLDEKDGLFVHFLNHNTEDEWANITHALVNSTSHDCTGCIDNNNTAGGNTSACCGADGCPCVYLSDTLCEHTSCVIDGSGACCTSNFANCSVEPYCNQNSLFLASAAYNDPITPGPSSKPSSAPSRMPSTFPSLSPSAVPSSDPSEGPSIVPTVAPSVIPSDTPSGMPSLAPSWRPSQGPTGGPMASPSSEPSAKPSDIPSTLPSSVPSSRPSAQPSTQPSGKPSVSPSSSPSNSPSLIPSASPSSLPSKVPTQRPTKSPSDEPSSLPSEIPTPSPTKAPTDEPTPQPTRDPTPRPSRDPTPTPSKEPTDDPTASPSTSPSTLPSSMPSSRPSPLPSRGPTVGPTMSPSSRPSDSPSSSPSKGPSMAPSVIPSDGPSSNPSSSPSTNPSPAPSQGPTGGPTAVPSSKPSAEPSDIPSTLPSLVPSSRPSGDPTMDPSGEPTDEPSAAPSESPSPMPSISPSHSPSSGPTRGPTVEPSSQPSAQPSMQTSGQPSVTPSSRPSNSPSLIPSASPSSLPSKVPTQGPTGGPTPGPTSMPSGLPSDVPSSSPSEMPSMRPSGSPSYRPSDNPSMLPSNEPSAFPSSAPTSAPSSDPSQDPSGDPTPSPSSFPSLGPSEELTGLPSDQPSDDPSSSPSNEPSDVPSDTPSSKPSSIPSLVPTDEPTGAPHPLPSSSPSEFPSGAPSKVPSSEPSSRPSSVPSVVPSPLPSLDPTNGPTPRPSDSPSSEPSTSPSHAPTSLPSASPSDDPSAEPSVFPSLLPSSSPSERPSHSPTVFHSPGPSLVPSIGPSLLASDGPSLLPSALPTLHPSDGPSDFHSETPSFEPSTRPSNDPTYVPSESPSSKPSRQPSKNPTAGPTKHPSAAPSQAPSALPSDGPSSVPSDGPSNEPSVIPSEMPSSQPSSVPSKVPTADPTPSPTLTPSQIPSLDPSSSPSSVPSGVPSASPSSEPSNEPSSSPSSIPSAGPSLGPTVQPSDVPSDVPSDAPSDLPSSEPSRKPSSSPSSMPSLGPSLGPTVQPSDVPSLLPSSEPSASPSSEPSSVPSASPSSQPSKVPSSDPSSSPSSEPSSLPSSQPSSVPSSSPSSEPSSLPSSQPSASPSSKPSKVPSSDPSSDPSSEPSIAPSTLRSDTSTGSCIPMNGTCTNGDGVKDPCCEPYKCTSEGGTGSIHYCNK